MRDFNQWLFEEYTVGIEIPNAHLAVSNRRADMPKLYDIAKFVADLGQNGIGMDVRMVDPKTLKPGQSVEDIDMDKVSGMMEHPNLTLDAPLYISKDLFVVDGHHRWVAAANNNVPILANHINMMFHDLIEFLNGLQYPLNKDVE